MINIYMEYSLARACMHELVGWVWVCCRSVCVWCVWLCSLETCPWFESLPMPAGLVASQPAQVLWKLPQGKTGVCRSNAGRGSDLWGLTADQCLTLCAHSRECMAYEHRVMQLTSQDVYKCRLLTEVRLAPLSTSSKRNIDRAGMQPKPVPFYPSILLQVIRRADPVPGAICAVKYTTHRGKQMPSPSALSVPSAPSPSLPASPSMPALACLRSILSDVLRAPTTAPPVLALPPAATQ